MARKDLRRRLTRMEKQTNTTPVEIAVLVAPPPDADEATRQAFDDQVQGKLARLKGRAPLVIIDF